MSTKESQIKINVQLDDNNIPEKLFWEASDGGQDLSDKQLKNLVETIYLDLKNHGKRIDSKIIGETVLIHLKEINEVAYLRFASVYKEFSDVTDFEKEAAELN